ncbi:MAG: hypothetical protein ACO29O_03915 [Chitinophagaceae bacterium]
MKNQIGVWIDLSKAVIISSDAAGHDCVTVTSDIDTHERFGGETTDFSRVGEHRLESGKHKENKLHNSKKVFFTELIPLIQDAEEIVIFGPAEVKMEFGKFIKEHKSLTGKLRAVETTDKMSENQMIAWVHQYFHSN